MYQHCVRFSHAILSMLTDTAGLQVYTCCTMPLLCYHAVLGTAGQEAGNDVITVHHAVGALQ